MFYSRETTFNFEIFTFKDTLDFEIFNFETFYVFTYPIRHFGLWEHFPLANWPIYPQLVSKCVLCNETICNYTKLNCNQPYVTVGFLELDKTDWKKQEYFFFFIWIWQKKTKSLNRQTLIIETLPPMDFLSTETLPPLGFLSTETLPSFYWKATTFFSFLFSTLMATLCLLFIQFAKNKKYQH